MSSLAAVTAELAREHLARGCVLKARAEGLSMWPTVVDGAIVEILPCDPRDAGIGDVVLVDLGNKLVLHRVIRRPGRRVLLKGDARPVPDGEVPESAIIGRMEPRPWDRHMARLSPFVGGVLKIWAISWQRLVSLF